MTIRDRRAWCVHDVIFTNESAPGATGTLKLFLENDEFVGPPGNYGMSRIGWLEARLATDFQTSSEYHPQVVYPFPYEALPGKTTISFEILCDANACDGNVRIEFDIIAAP